ncbi:MAG: D-alanyl-D-alanine carboxypeptidase, partial [Candidatus Kapaibacterium sp.]
MIAASSLSFITSEARRCMARIVATMLVVMAADISVVAEGTRVAADGRVQTAERKSDTLRPELRQDRRPGRQALRELQRDIDGILASRDFSRANIGVSVVSADNGEVIYRMNDERMFVPASTQKLFTTAVALETLGKDFRYSTRLYLDGTTSPSGEFRGNMIVRGSGDPTWSAFFRRDALAILDTWVATLDSLGITGVRG